MTAKTTEKQKKAGEIILPEQNLQPGLYVVATPIGNLADITLRALAVLNECDLIFCEDTRVSKKLLSHYGIKTPLKVYNDHSREQDRQAVLDHLRDNKAVALISDAGTPLISDPGYKLIRAVSKSNLFYTVVPGPSAVLNGLQLAGLPTDRFGFFGFVPARKAQRLKFFEELQALDISLVMFETANRLVSCLEDMSSVFIGRDIRVMREMTKRFEEIRGGLASEMFAHYSEYGPPKGEIVIVAGPKAEGTFDDDAVTALLREALENMTTKDAARHIARKTGRPRQEIYDMSLAVKDNDL